MTREPQAPVFPSAPVGLPIGAVDRMRELAAERGPMGFREYHSRVEEPIIHHDQVDLWFSLVGLGFYRCADPVSRLTREGPLLAWMRPRASTGISVGYDGYRTDAVMYALLQVYQLGYHDQSLLEFILHYRSAVVGKLTHLTEYQLRIWWAPYDVKRPRLFCFTEKRPGVSHGTPYLTRTAAGGFIIGFISIENNYVAQYQPCCHQPPQER